jgi:hypothetical protein
VRPRALEVLSARRANAQPPHVEGRWLGIGNAAEGCIEAVVVYDPASVEGGAPAKGAGKIIAGAKGEDGDSRGGLDVESRYCLDGMRRGCSAAGS